MLSSIPDKLHTGLHRPIRAKLIFNPGSGQLGESPQQLVGILSEMQNQHITPEVFMIQPGCHLGNVVHGALKSGIKLIVVAGGDGTIDSVAGAMVGREATLGIIPIGTRNNVAFNLGITGNIADSVALLRNGRRLKIDAGRATCGHSRQWFLEGVALGLISDLYPILDDIQHGNLTVIGELLSTLVSATPSRLRMVLDGLRQPDTSAHLMLITNMPFLGPHFQVSSNVSFKDGYLDIFTFSNMSKLNVLSYAILSGGGAAGDVGIQHYRAKTIKIISDPQMPVLADGILLGKGSSTVQVYPRALKVMAGAELTGQSATTVVGDPELEPDEK